MAEPLRTERLLLVPATADLIDAELESVDTLAYALNATADDSWLTLTTTTVLPLFANQLRANSALVGWLDWYWLLVDGDQAILIGNGGFKGPPDDEGQVEIGYEIIPAYHGRGYATEAVMALVGWALQHRDVDTVVAECLPDNRASIRVLEKCGFVEVGDGLEEGTRLWELAGD